MQCVLYLSSVETLGGLFPFLSSGVGLSVRLMFLSWCYVACVFHFASSVVLLCCLTLFLIDLFLVSLSRIVFISSEAG